MSGEIRTLPVRAQLVDDVDRDGTPAGGFEFFTSGGRPEAGMLFRCPCGCGKLQSLDFRPHDSPSWEWDGNRDAPTLQPSVHMVGHWHGWLRAGIWESV